jgi:hypothetical protein
VHEVLGAEALDDGTDEPVELVLAPFRFPLPGALPLCLNEVEVLLCRLVEPSILALSICSGAGGVGEKRHLGIRKRP